MIEVNNSLQNRHYYQYCYYFIFAFPLSLRTPRVWHCLPENRDKNNSCVVGKQGSKETGRWVLEQVTNLQPNTLVNATYLLASKLWIKSPFRLTSDCSRDSATANLQRCQEPFPQPRRLLGKGRTHLLGEESTISGTKVSNNMDKNKYTLRDQNSKIHSCNSKTIGLCQKGNKVWNIVMIKRQKC